MFFHTGREFEIYSIGDGLYMQRVLNGVAAMSNDGILLQLVAFGLLIGLLIMGVKNVMAGGMKLEIGTFLASFLLAVFLFGLRADVVVHDMSYVPGQKVQGDFTVANLPFGIAAIGSFVSTVGYTLTERMEQGYSIPAMAEMGMSRGGFGKILEWVNSIRLWELPTAETPSSRDLTLFQRNLTAYIRECTLPAVDMGHICLESVRAAQDPLSMHTSNCTGGIGYGSHYRMVEFVTGFGGGGGSGGKDTSTYTCNDAHQVLLNNAGTGEAGFYKALGSVFPETVAAQSAQSTFAAAYESIGVASGHVQGVVLANAVGASLDRAMRSYEHRMSLTTLSEVMIEQASQQRLVQWAAEETMFRRIMRPMMAFFESLMYALAPFMALAVGLGTFGITTVFRYMMLTVWVSLWMPVLSVIQLFQITSVQHVVRALYDPMTGSDAMNPTSIAGAHLLRSEALEWMATGAALAAWTPAITMALVFSGAITASALAGKMQGQDTINEKLTAPDHVNAPPALQRGSMGEFQQVGGGKHGGASLPTLDWGSAVSKTQASSAEANQSVSETFSNVTRTAISSGLSDDQRREMNRDLARVGIASDGRQGQFTEGGGAEQSADSSIRATHGNSRAYEASALKYWETSFNGGLSAGLGTKAAGPAGSVGVNHTRGTGERNTGTVANRDGVEGGSGTGVSSNDRSGYTNTRTGGNDLSTVAGVRQHAADGSSWAQKLVDTWDNSKQLQAATSRAESYREAADNTQRSSTGFSETAPAAIDRMSQSAPGGSAAVSGALLTAVDQTNSQAAYQAAHTLLYEQGARGDRLTGGAALMALMGHHDNQVGSDSGMASLSERAVALGDALDGAYGGAVGGVFHADSNSDIGGSLQSYKATVDGMDKPTQSGPPSGAAGMRQRLDAGAPAPNMEGPDSVVGNKEGDPNNLQPEKMGGDAPHEYARAAGETAKEETRKEGHSNLAAGYDQVVDPSGNPAIMPAHVSLPARGADNNPNMISGNASGDIGRDEFESRAAALAQQLPDAPESVVRMTAASDMISSGHAFGHALARELNEAHGSSMTREETGAFLGYADQARGQARQERDYHRSQAGEAWEPVVLNPDALNPASSTESSEVREW